MNVKISHSIWLPFCHGFDGLGLLQTIPSGALRWRHNGCDSISNHQPHDCLLNRLFRRRSMKTSKLRVTDLCAGAGEFPAQMASNAENVSIWWHHHGPWSNDENIDQYIPWIQFKIPNKSISSISHYVLHILLTAWVHIFHHHSEYFCLVHVGHRRVSPKWQESEPAACDYSLHGIACHCIIPHYNICFRKSNNSIERLI